jgi:hypothetical protein
VDNENLEESLVKKAETRAAGVNDYAVDLAHIQQNNL